MRGAILSASVIAVALVLGEYTISSLLNFNTLQVVINLLGKRDAFVAVAVSLVGPDLRLRPALRHRRFAPGAAGAAQTRLPRRSRRMTAPTLAAGGPGSGVAVQFQDMHRWYGSVHALDGLTIDIAPGELVALLGPSGCGKTTALRALGGLDEPDAGRILVDGKDITRRPREQARHGHRVPGVQPVPEHDAPATTWPTGCGCAAWARPSAASARRAMLDLVGLEQAGRPLPVPDVGRPAAAGRARPGARDRAEGAPPRRATLGARRQGAPAAPRGDPADPDRRRNDDAVRHPRPGGGAGAGRSRRRHVGRPARADRRAGRAVRPPADRLRGRVRRAHQSAARHRGRRRRRGTRDTSPAARGIGRDRAR